MIVLRAKEIEFDITYVDLGNKPAWFLDISPHGKVPVLLVDEQPLFESNAIAEYLDEVAAPRLHPADAVKRARNRAWTDFIDTFADRLGAVYYAGTGDDLAAALGPARDAVAKLEVVIADARGNDGPYFNGETLSLVDAAYAPFLQRFTMVEEKLGTGLLDAYPLVSAWAQALLGNACVSNSNAESFEREFIAGLKRRGALAGALF